MQKQRTYVDQPRKVKRTWYILDLAGQRLGRAATQIAVILRGKHKPTYTPHVDGGDFVIAINAAKITLTGGKETKKMYYRHSGYPGGLKSITAGQLRDKNPERMIELAVQRMLPKNVLGRQQGKKLKVYREAEHPHTAQQPQPWYLYGQVREEKA